MKFNILYNYLARRTFKPTTYAKCRVYMAKNLRSYSPRYQETMHQFIGAHWNPILQQLDHDGFMLKKLTKVVVHVIIVLILAYVYLF